MPVKIIGESCPEWIEAKVRGTCNKIENRKCGKPVYLNGVCVSCWRMNEKLRGEYNPMQVNAAAERLDASGYERLGIEDETLDQKDIDLEIRHAMNNFDASLTELLK